MLSKLGYYLLIKPLSLLPLFVLHLLSNWLYYLNYYVLKYRRSVITSNINRAFPEKTTKERKAIVKSFYRYFGDLIVESIKMFSISETEAIRRCQVRNPEVINQFYDNHRNIVIVGSHYSNWEFTAVAFPAQFKHQIASIYAKLNNAFFDRKVTQSRTRYGSELIPISRAPGYYEEVRDRPVVLGFLSDQTPVFHPDKKLHWTTFLHQDTPVALGVERYAVKYDLPVVYVDVHKIKRGYYEVQLVLITDQPRKLAPGEITERHVRCLEMAIARDPGRWLWSHRRWKYDRSGKRIG